MILDATGSSVDIGGGVDDDDEEEFYDSEPLPILGRCKSLYPFEGKIQCITAHILMHQ